MKRDMIGVGIVFPNNLGHLVYLSVRNLDGFFFASIQIKTKDLNFGRNGRVEEDWKGGRGLGFGRQAERCMVRVENGRTFGKNVDGLFADDQGVVV